MYQFFNFFRSFPTKKYSNVIITHHLDVCLFLSRKTSPNMTVDNQQAPLLLRIPNSARDPELGFKEVLLKLRFSPLKELEPLGRGEELGKIQVGLQPALLGVRVRLEFRGCFFFFLRFFFVMRIQLISSVFMQLFPCYSRH